MSGWVSSTEEGGVGHWLELREVMDPEQVSGSLGVGDKSSGTDQNRIPQAQARSGGGIKASTVCARGWPQVGGWGERSLGDRD